GADVVGERRPPGDVLDAVVARQACANGFHFTPPMLVMPGLGAVVARSNESPLARAATASMIFTYPVQRQTWPPRASLIAPWSSEPPPSTYACAAIIIPDVQNPHCAA